MAVQLAPGLWLHDADEAPGRQGLWLPRVPTRAFGDGSHPTTRACARAVDLLCRQRRPRALLDVGTGTGLLARIARARGVPDVVATDIDPLALDAARAHAALDKRARALTLSSDAPDCWGPRFDMVVANILEGPLRALAPALVAALAPGGLLLLSGFTPAQVPRLRVHYEALGCSDARASTLDGWSVLQLTRLGS
jgi:ribosomal protein L11 methyltransferase